MALDSLSRRKASEINEEVKLQTTRRVLVTSRNLKKNENKSKIKKTSKSALVRMKRDPGNEVVMIYLKTGEGRIEILKIAPILSLKRKNREDFMT